MRKFRIINAAVAGFFLADRAAQRDVGAWVNSAQSLRPLPAFVCVCVVFGEVVQLQHDFVGVWVNSAQSLRPLPAFVCVVVFGAMVQARLVGTWVNSAQSLRPLPAFVCVVVFGFGAMVQHDLWVRG